MAQYFTKEGLQKLKDELNQLETVENKRIVALLKEAAAFGDLKENAAYHDARDKLAFLRGRIEQLKNVINEAVILENDKNNDRVQIGSEVVILFGKDEEKYQLVAPGAANVLQNKISYLSPFGSQLMGKPVGDEFDYLVREKKIKVKILDIK
jgi:transcription elongation factor GreA